jgi:hypothetical protein
MGKDFLRVCSSLTLFNHRSKPIFEVGKEDLNANKVIEFESRET